MKPLFRVLGRCAAVLSALALLGNAYSLHAQDVRRVTGKVLDAETKEPLLGAVIKVKGTKVGTVVRRSDGEFSIDVPTTSSQILVVSLVGKVTEEVNVAGRENVTIYLKNDVLELQKVVVTAVGIEREKRSLGYATQEISGTSISQNREQNLVNALVGKVAGVQINSSSGSPGSASYIRLRGVNSISFNNQPAFVVDGVLIDNSDYAAFTNASNAAEASSGNAVNSVDQVSRILDINPDDIESINVLKGAAATSLYGLAHRQGRLSSQRRKGGVMGQSTSSILTTLHSIKSTSCQSFRTSTLRGSMVGTKVHKQGKEAHGVRSLIPSATIRRRRIRGTKMVRSRGSQTHRMASQ